jgi:hypothetical protein
MIPTEGMIELKKAELVKLDPFRSAFTGHSPRARLYEPPERPRAAMCSGQM